MVLKKTLESPLDCKKTQPVHPKGDQSWKDWCWSWNSNTLANLCEELTQWKRPWCWERLRAEEEGDDRGWDGWMASPTQWTWVWVNSVSWWWTGRPGVLRFTGSQRVGHNWATERNWNDGTKATQGLSRWKYLVLLTVPDSVKLHVNLLIFFFQQRCTELPGRRDNTKH